MHSSVYPFNMAAVFLNMRAAMSVLVYYMISMGHGRERDRSGLCRDSILAQSDRLCTRNRDSSCFTRTSLTHTSFPQIIESALSGLISVVEFVIGV